MLIFSLNRVLASRGIEMPFKFLVKLGLTRAVAFNLTNYVVANIKIAHLEKICRAMNCTPNDLFEWQPDANDAIGENHALNSLKRSKTTKSISRILKEIPMEKLEKAEEFLNQLKNEE